MKESFIILMWMVISFEGSGEKKDIKSIDNKDAAAGKLKN